jgi:hypothetical protein
MLAQRVLGLRPGLRRDHQTYDSPYQGTEQQASAEITHDTPPPEMTAIYRPELLPEKV